MITDVLNAFKFGQDKGQATIELTISADMIAKAAAMVKPPQ